MIKNLTLAKLMGLLCLLFYYSSAQAQTPADSTAQKSVLKIGVSYINNDVFYGRADTVKTPTIIPLIKYTFKSGVYLSGDLDYVTNRKSNKLDGGSLTAGYEFSLTDALEGEFSFSKFFYNANSTQVNSSNRANLSGSLNYDIAGIITPSVTVDYDLNRSGVGNDVYVNAGLSHDFTLQHPFGWHDHLTLSPSAEINTGTQNFYDDYIVRRTTRNKKTAATQSAALAADHAQLSHYKLLDYEFALPVEYGNQHIIVNFTPTYALAQNKLPATISSALSNGSHIFYIKAGITLLF